jgi:hypothetical protein
MGNAGSAGSATVESGRGDAGFIIVQSGGLTRKRQRIGNDFSGKKIKVSVFYNGGPGALALG